jgi:uncharacterized protein
MASNETKTGLRVTVVYSPEARQTVTWELDLEAGATVLAALNQTVFSALPGLRASRPSIGIWGKKTTLQHSLADRDRLEVYRVLVVDPKTARRERFNRQGARAAGLFARKRAGAKAGY